MYRLHDSSIFIETGEFNDVAQAMASALAISAQRWGDGIYVVAPNGDRIALVKAVNDKGGTL